MASNEVVSQGEDPAAQLREVLAIMDRIQSLPTGFQGIPRAGTP